MDRNAHTHTHTQYPFNQIHALGNLIYKKKETALRVVKCLGSEPEKIILSESLKTFIEKGFDSSSNSFGQYIDYLLDAVKSSEMAKKFVEQGALKILIDSIHTAHKKNKWNTYVKTIGGIRSLVLYCPKEVYVVFERENFNHITFSNVYDRGVRRYV